MGWFCGVKPARRRVALHVLVRATVLHTLSHCTRTRTPHPSPPPSCIPIVPDLASPPSFAPCSRTLGLPPPLLRLSLPFLPLRPVLQRRGRRQIVIRMIRMIRMMRMIRMIRRVVRVRRRGWWCLWKSRLLVARVTRKRQEGRGGRTKSDSQELTHKAQNSREDQRFLG